MFCLEPPYKGPGKAVLPRFFFNTRSGFCEAFVFGGGKAKLNNFLTKDECISVCSGRRPAFQTQYKLELQAQPELKHEPVGETQHRGPACRNVAPENQDEDEDEEGKPEDEDEKPEDEDEKREDEDSDLKEDDEDEDEVNDEDGNKDEEPQV